MSAMLVMASCTREIGSSTTVRCDESKELKPGKTGTPLDNPAADEDKKLKAPKPPLAAGAPKIFCVGVEANAAGADEKPNAVGVGAAAGLGKPPAPNAVAAGAAEGPVRPKPAPKGAGAAPKGAGVPDAAV